jgi:hypothetical protein
MKGDTGYRTFGEGEARAILAEAIRIDHLKADGLSLNELKSAAAEVGIGEASLMQAVAVLDSRQAAAARSVRHLPGLILGSGAAGAGVAFLTHVIAPSLLGGSPPSYAPIAFLGMFMISGGIAALKGRKGARIAFLDFQARNLGVWVGFGLGTYFAIRGPMGDLEGLLSTMVVGTVAVFWAGTSAVGGAFATWLGRRTEERNGPSRPLGQGFAELKRSWGLKMKKWIDDTMMRARLGLSPR